MFSLVETYKVSTPRPYLKARDVSRWDKWRLDVPKPTKCIAMKSIGNRGYDCLWQGIVVKGIGRSLPLS